jgi:hypothetical protein
VAAGLYVENTPSHADFITATGPEGPYDWTIPNIGDVDDALHSAFFARTDGSSGRYGVTGRFYIQKVW